MWLSDARITRLGGFIFEVLSSKKVEERGF